MIGPGEEIAFPVTIAWGDQDPFGHVNNVAYFRYLESARMHLLERLGFMELHRATGLSVILAATQCQFRKAINWPATIEVRMSIPRIGHTSFDIAYRILGADGSLHAEGTSTQVVYDYTEMCKCPMPESIRNTIFALFKPGTP
ncbi:MAG: acyl-CoA thioesterase [Flavobacteriales bacterium]|nr:acyl-CoA thioesterase [Flavobacteriales bacterium]